MNLVDVYKAFPDQDSCYEFLEKMRWPAGVRCPICGNDKVSRIRSSSKKQTVRRLYECLEATCHQQFTAISGTILHDTHLPLQKWLLAIALITNAKKGMSAKQLQRDLGVGYRTAWYLCHRIRKAMQDDRKVKLTGTVEVDETYVGGKHRGAYGRSKEKEIVVGMIERGGDLKLMHAPDTNAATMYNLLVKHISPKAEAVVTDDYSVYPWAMGPTLRPKHKIICHKREYVRGDIHTNTIESAFSLFKRGIVGQYHQISAKHLHRYLNEFEWRFNNRENPHMFADAVKRLTSKAGMPFKELVKEN
jgi:transposase-like protein